MTMRPNPVRERILSGGSAVGIMAFEFFTPGLPALLAAAGAEFVILDTEHSGIGIDTLRAQLAGARGLPIMPFVRVSAGQSHLIAPVLDAGAMGIMVPMVETGQQARDIVRWCRYRPEGTRGLGFGLAHDDFTDGDVRAKIRKANARTLTIALIESATGIANADDILGTPGIDVGWLGHYDLTDSMGITGEFDHPDFARAVETFLAACSRHGKPAGILAADVETALAWRRQGFRVLCYGTDTGLLKGALAQGVQALRKAEP
jgi:2-keto-3-deoxy-L-rhamnonate aldolase RhmA